MSKPQEESSWEKGKRQERGKERVEDEKPSSVPSDKTLTVTLLSSEWKSSKGGLSTISRELAIQLAEHLNVKVYVYLPKCSEEDKKVADSHSVQLIEAKELPGFEPIDWLSSLPKGHLPHCLIGHGLHLGRQIPAIQRHHDCKWVQVVHTAPEELGMYKSYEEAISKGEQKHREEVKLCKLADQVVAIGPKLADAYSRHLRSSSKDQDVIDLTPSIFTEFLNVEQATEERRTFCVLVFGRGDGEDFELKGYDIAVQAIAELEDSSYQLMFVGAPTGKENEVAEKLLQYGILSSQLTVRRFIESREELAKLFCEVDLAIMPSRTEGFGLTALEALSAGLPVLVGSNCGLGDALKKVPSGFSHVVDSEDPKEWAKAIKRVRQRDREVRLEEAKLLREKYALKYSWRKQCECLVEKMLNLSFGNIQGKREQEQSQNEKVDNLEKLKKTSQGAESAREKGEDKSTPVKEIPSKQDRQTFANLQQMQRDASKVSSSTGLLAELEKIASDKGFVISDNEGSGNCMFYAVSEQLNLVKGIEISHEELRRSIVQYLRKYPKLPDGTDLFGFTYEYQSWPDYLTNMNQDGTWGDHVILYATANCYKTYIHVISSQSNHPDVTIKPDGHVISTDPLVLGHVHENHYVSLQPKQERNIIQQPSGAVLTGRVTGEVLGATQSAHDSGDSIGEGSALERKHSEPDRKCVRDGIPTDKELEELGNKVTEWKQLGRRLELNDPQLEEINQVHNQLSEKVYHMLLRWKQGKSSSATYKVLCDALEHKLVQRKDLADQFCYINAVHLKIDVEAMQPTEHSTQDRTSVSTVESGGSRNVEQHGASELPVNTGALQESTRYPSVEQVLCSISDWFMQVCPPRSCNGFYEFRDYLKSFGAILRGARTGSLLITVQCDSLQILERLWEDYLSGDLGEVIQRSFVTEEILAQFSLAELKLKTTISEEEYKACKAYFEKDTSEENATALLTAMSRPAQKSGKRLEDSKGEPPEHTIVVPEVRDLPRGSKPSTLKIPIDILLVAAKNCEFLSCYAHLKNPFKCYIASLKTYVYFGQDAKMKIGLMRGCEASTSSDSSLITAVKNAITTLQPKGAIFVGYCSGLNKMKVKLGDVVVPVELTTYAHDFVVNGEKHFTGKRCLVSRRFLQLINHVADGWKAPLKNSKVPEVKVHSDGEILSRPGKVSTDKRPDQLVQLYPEAVAVEMEVKGLYTAAIDTGIEWLIIKGIADFAGGNESRIPRWQSFASVMAASVVFNFLSHANYFSDWPHYQGGKRLQDNKDEPPEHTIAVQNLDDLPRDEGCSGLLLPIDILLVTVEDCEFLSCYAHLRSPYKCRVATVGTYVYFGEDAEMKIGLMRRDEALIDPDSYLRAVKKAITELRPKVAISVGYCSGLNKLETKLGDVIIPVELTTYANEMGQHGEELFTGVRRLVSRRFLQPINHVADGWTAPLKSPEVREVEVHSDGEILSGPEKVSTDERRDQLVQLYPRAVAVETEGEGLFTAAFDTGIEWLIFKGIAGFAGGNESSTLPWQRFASVMAASVVFKFLSHANVFSDWPHYEENIRYKRFKDDERSAPVKYCTSITQAELAEEIRQLYTTHEGYVTPFPWREEFQCYLDSISTTLQVVSTNKARGTMTADSVNISNIFKPHGSCRQPRTVLIEGKPGAGKTTLCRKLAYDWATGKPWTTGKQEEKDCFPRFETVLFLNCCDMKSDLCETIDCQLFPKDVEERERKQFFSSIVQNETNVLLVLDGLDEVAESKLPMISEIIEGKELPKCRLVATARHEVGSRVQKHCDTLLEVKRFTKEDAESFIFKNFQESEDMAKKLLSELTRDANLKDMAASPLNIALLCHVFEENDGSVPESRSQLYLDVAGCVLKRYKKKEGLPETNDLIDEYEAQLKQLGDIALKGLLEEKYDFEESELKSDAKKSPAFEFLSPQNGRTKIRSGLRYSFQHSSFQEWFAGFFLCCQLIEKKVSPESLIDDKRYAHGLKEVLPYTCGLLAARRKEDAVPQAVTLTKCMMTEVNQGDRNGWLTVVLECTRECKQKNGSFQATMARELGSLLNLQTLDLHALDLHVGKRGAANVFVLADVLKSNTTVIELNLCDNDIDDAGAVGLADVLEFNTTLTVLNLSENSIGDAGAAGLADVLKFNTTLTVLNLSENSIGDAGAAGLADALKSNKTLTELNLCSSGIYDDGAKNLADAMKSNRALTELNLGSNCIHNAGAEGVADALKSNKTLMKLNLGDNYIDDPGAQGLADALKSNKTLTELNLCNNGMGDDCAKSLADALKSNTALTRLYLSGNYVSNYRLAGLERMLESNKKH